MKNQLIISLLILLLGCSTSEKQSNNKSQKEYNKESQKEYNLNDLIEMDNGLWTEKFSDEPISGKVYDYFGEKSNPKKVYSGNLRNGKKEGKWKEWYSNGRKKEEGTYKDGKQDGLWKEWYSNGRKGWETTYKDGELVDILGDWNPDGSIKE